MIALRNCVTLIGRITHDLELRKTNSDIPVLSFSIAVDRPGTNKDNRITDFFDCTAWRGTAENICKFFSKGDGIGIIGSLQTNTFKDKDGNDRKKTEVLIESFEFLPGRKQKDGQGETPTSQPVPVEIKDGELPF